MNKNLFCLFVSIVGIFLILLCNYNYNNSYSESYGDPNHFVFFKYFFDFVGFGGKFIYAQKGVDKIGFLGFKDGYFNMIVLNKDGTAVRISNRTGVEDKNWKWKKIGNYQYEITTTEGEKVGVMKME
jgi:hypothetical protein